MKYFHSLFNINGRASSSQLWFHIVNLVVTILYLFIGIKIGLVIGINVANAAQLVDSFTWLTIAVAGIITGNKFANTLAHLKLGDKNANTAKFP